jgi:hypothetical protein
MKRRQFTSTLAASAALPVLSLISSPTHAALGEIKVSLDDYTKRFLSFYDYANTAVSPPRADASAPALPAVVPDADQRWATYKKVYDGNPRNLDETKWRAEFEAAWPKYANALEVIRGGFKGLAPSPADVIGGIGGALRMEQSLALTFICYVGTFSGQVASGVKPVKRLLPDGTTQEVTQPYVAFEAETYASGGDKALALAMSDIGIQTAGYDRLRANTIGDGIILNGVYMFAARNGLSLSSMEPLLAPAGVNAESRTPEALRALRAKLQAPLTNASQSDLLYAGAMIVDRWHARGLSIQEILRTPKDQVAKVTAAVLDQMIKK